MASTVLIPPSARVSEIGKDLFAQVRRHQGSIARFNKWTQEIIEWCLSNPDVKGRLLRFVDVLPSLGTDKILTEHLRDYFSPTESRLPLALRGGSVLTRTPFTGRAVGAMTRHMAREVAKQFICGSSIDEAIDASRQMAEKNMTVTLDLLGEAVMSELESDRYQKTYLDMIGRFPAGSNFSLKLTALCPRFDPLAFEQSISGALRRLLPIIELARSKDTFICIDAEQFQFRDMTLELTRRLLAHEKAKGYPHLGLVFQAYLKDSHARLEEFIAWLRERQQPLTIRLVKGAYWDSEVAKAQSVGWPVPVWLAKESTDAQFEAMTSLLMQNRDLIRAAIATHNVRSVAYALAAHESAHFPEKSLEFQLLFGMADALKMALVEKGLPVRIYAPFGPLIPGMAYLVRRILENTSNESFLKLDMTHGANEVQLLSAPRIREPASIEPDIHTEVSIPTFHNEPPLDFSSAAVRSQFEEALTRTSAEFGRDYFPLVDGGKVEGGQPFLAQNPSHPSQLLGRVHKANSRDAERAVNIALKAQESWDAVPASRRADLLQRAADLMHQRRMKLAAWEIFETGKTWREADADVAEAIDFLRFYSTTLLDYQSASHLRQVPGEVNVSSYHGRGVAAIISPWNFPLAIVTGMASAALAGGNAALIKPSAFSSIMARHLVEVLLEAGVPTGIVAFLPGGGDDVGRYLIRHPEVDLIAFTGSKEVGLSILKDTAQISPGQTNVKKAILEMGGKNAVIVDEDADLDEALAGVLESAFGYQGQKCSACSRLILLDPIYRVFVNRLVEAVRGLRTGDPTKPQIDLGPLISSEAFRKVQGAINEGQREARLLFQGRVEPGIEKGYFIPPTLFCDAPTDGVLGKQEIFGPVLTIFRADNFEEAISLANESEFALTGGVYSRSLRHLEAAKRYLVCGNLYINRKITGASVSRQPFGGFRMSGTGTKAGGYEYLSHFMTQTVITENTLRHGFPIE